MADERLDVGVLRRYIWFTTILNHFAEKASVYQYLTQCAPDEAARAAVAAADMLRQYVRADFDGEAAFEDPVVGELARQANALSAFKTKSLVLGVDRLLAGWLDLLRAANGFLESV